MSNLKPVGLFHTPADMEELQNWLSKFTGQEAVAVNTAAFMAWNLAAKLTREVFTDSTEEEA